VDKSASVSHVGDDLALWLEIGQQSGWCSDVVCGTHDGTPLLDSEYDLFEEGGDPCIPTVRIYVPEDMK